MGVVEAIVGLILAVSATLLFVILITGYCCYMRMTRPDILKEKSMYSHGYSIGKDVMTIRRYTIPRVHVTDDDGELLKTAYVSMSSVEGSTVV